MLCLCIDVLGNFFLCNQFFFLLSNLHHVHTSCVQTITLLLHNTIIKVNNFFMIGRYIKLLFSLQSGTQKVFYSEIYFL